MDRGHIGNAVAIAIMPAVVVPAMLVLVGDSLWPSVLAYHAFCLGVPLASRCRFGKAGFVLADLRAWLPLTITLSVLLVAAGGVVTSIVHVEMFLPHGWQQLLARIEPWWVFAAYSLCVNPVLEEFFWRGFLAPKTGVVAGAGLFWLMHVTGTSVFFTLPDAMWFTLPTFGAAVVWGLMRQRLQTLWPCVITHAAADAAILSIASGLRP